MESNANQPEGLHEKRSALVVSHLHKSFKLPTEKASGVKQAVVNLAKGVKGYKEFKVLQDINFEVKEGDFFGVVGRNGSGKSTLLKLISQIYHPDKGSVQVNGKLVPFIELGVGFNPELTGRENIYMNGALLGFSNEEVDEMYEEIVDFAELHDFMEQKLKNYSSGMQVRLAFSIAIKAEADILVLDEVLAVGDEAFQRKCNEYFANLKKNKKTVILVTHDMSAVRKYCNRAILIKDGKIIIDGTPEDVANEYSVLNLEHAEYDARIDGLSAVKRTKSDVGLSRQIPYLRIIPVSKSVLTSDNDFVFDIEWESTIDEPCSVHFALVSETHGNSQLIHSGSAPVDGAGIHKLQYVLPLKSYNDTSFLIVANINDSNDKQIAFTNDSNSCRFVIRNGEGNSGLIRTDSPLHGYWNNWQKMTYNTHAVMQPGGGQRDRIF